MKICLLLIPILSACGQIGEMCTQIGCMSGISLSIYDSYGSPVSGSYGTITVDGTEYTYDCNTADQLSVICDEETVLLLVEEGESIVYSINFADESASGETQLDFEESNPNGDDCPPTCYYASITVELFRSFE